jgi:hypothetical protein
MRSKRVFCTMLITPSGANEWEPDRQAMRQFAKHSGLSRTRFRFMYLSAETQPEFVRSLLSSTSVDRSSSSSSPASSLNSHHMTHSIDSNVNFDGISIAPQANNHNREQQLGEMAGLGLADDPKVYYEITPHPDDLQLRVLVLARSRWEHMLFEYLPMRWNSSDVEHFNQTQEHLYVNRCFISI